MDVSKHSISSWVYEFEQRNNLELGTSTSYALEDYLFNQMVTRKDKPTVVCNTPVYKTDTTYEEVLGQLVSDHFKLLDKVELLENLSEDLQKQKGNIQKVLELVGELSNV